MKFAKPLGLMVVLAMLLPAQAALASHGRGNSDQPKTEKAQKNDKEKKEKKEKNPVVPVPEPTTIALLGAAAGVAGARKMWKNRRRSKSE